MIFIISLNLLSASSYQLRVIKGGSSVITSGRVSLVSTAEETPPVCMEINLLDLCFEPHGEEIRQMICGDAKIKKDSALLCTSFGLSEILNILNLS